VDVLSQLVEQTKEENRLENDKEKKKHNSHRISALENSINLLKDTQIEITSGYQAMQLFKGGKGTTLSKGIGKGTADRIDEIIETGTLKELNLEVSEESKAMTSLTKIPGIGDKHAAKYYHEYGIKSAEDMKQLWQSGELVKRKIAITHEMETGLKYYEDLQFKIPYDEIALIRPIIEPMLEDIEPKLTYEICGSHRREKALSGDIDILICHNGMNSMEELKKMERNILAELIDMMIEAGFVIDDLLIKPGMQFRGICRLKELARQIDFHLVSKDIWPTALMHGTGSKKFNVLMRDRALRMGYTLTEFGLFELNEDGKKGKMMPIKSERDVFKTLKVKYLEPKRREL
jgi:DNA polymerase/3'-5' exonuclease PolX